jgi:hypothetical protein
VLVLNGESEMMRVFPVRQVGSHTFRIREMAGTAYAGGGANQGMDEIVPEDGLQPLLQPGAVNTVGWGFDRNVALEQVVVWANCGPLPRSFPPIATVLARGRATADELWGAGS